MKLTKIISPILLLVIIFLMGLNVFASIPNKDIPNNQITEGTDEEQNIETETWKTQYNNLKKKWAALSDAQKEEIYQLKDKIIDTQLQIIDKYVEWEIIDESKAVEIKEGLIDSKTNIRDNDRFPMPACRSGHDKR
ncbi:MAG: DUF2680 domain-containing protein [Eubacteriales bacterium]